MPAEPSRDAKSLAPLFALYFSQGLPFGFQATALPVLLRERGVTLSAIGFSSVLALPWLIKALWAPLVDRYGSQTLGRRKSWIVPMQAALALTSLSAAQVEGDMVLLAFLVLLMNVFAATQDIAVDALAVDRLQREQLGPGNALQVVGYKLGMLTGGGLLVWASARIGWRGLFLSMAALMLVVLGIAVCMREPSTQRASSAPPRQMGAILTRLGAALRQPSTAALIAVVVTYKAGESLVDPMWKPMLVDRGFSAADIGLWNGTFGMLSSLLGSTAAGLCVRRTSLARALLVAALLRVGGVGAEWWVSLAPHASAASVVVVTCLEHLLGGAITTVLFALMMRHADREIGATHYTLLASLEVWGKVPLSVLSGVLATALGYPAIFAAGTLLCLAFAMLTRVLQPRLDVAWRALGEPPPGRSS